MSAFTISDWKDVAGGALRAVFTLTVPGGFSFHETKYFVKDDSRWVKLPDREYVKKDGAKGYMPVITMEKEKREMFNSLALDAVDEFLASFKGMKAAENPPKPQAPTGAPRAKIPPRNSSW